MSVYLLLDANDFRPLEKAALRISTAKADSWHDPTTYLTHTNNPCNSNIIPPSRLLLLVLLPVALPVVFLSFILIATASPLCLGRRTSQNRVG